MAEKSELSAAFCLVWNTNRPSPTTPRRSNDFLLMGVKSHLRWVNATDSEDDVYCISLNRATESEQPKKPFQVVTHVENLTRDDLVVGMDGLPILTDEVLVTSEKNTVIWRFSVDCVLWKCGTDNYSWRVVCVFHGVASSAFQSEKETINLSDKADTSSSTTAEKGVQTSVKIPSNLQSKCIQASMDIPPNIERLSDDFSNLLTKDIFPDMELNCGGHTRSVHRSILAVRSEVFAAMFRNKMAESETGSVDIKDMDVPILDMFLQYVYTGTIPHLTDNTATRLYEASDKYAIITLKRVCSDWMASNISEENCVTFLNAADAHSDDVFKQSVITFIFDHPTVFKSDSWIKLSKENITLAYEVIGSYAFYGRNN